MFRRRAGLPLRYDPAFYKPLGSVCAVHTCLISHADCTACETMRGVARVRGTGDKLGALIRQGLFKSSPAPEYFSGFIGVLCLYVAAVAIVLAQIG